MRFASDNLSMLLSSDWFINVWALCGLQSSEAVRSRVQKGCRPIVESVVEGCTTYWDSEFSETRGLRTTAELIAVFDRAGMPSEDQNICKRYVDGVDESPEPTANMTLVETLCELFVSEYQRGEGLPDQFGERVAACVQAALEEMGAERLLVVAGSRVVTKWDQWLRQLTPDLPMFTVDTARELTRHAGSHARLVGVLRSGLNEDELRRLGEWLSTSAAELANVTLPPTILTSS